VPEAKDWITKILSPFNSFVENVYSAFRGQIDFDNNVRAEKREFTLNTTDFPFKFTTKFAPEMIIIGQVRVDAGSHTNLTNAPFPDWEYGNDGFVTLYTITGLTVGVDYIIKLLII
jgi:hypothetical protein